MFTLESNEVKASVSLPDFNNSALAARAWADEVEQKQKLLIENQELATKALSHDAVAVAEDAISITQAAKSLSTGRNRLYSIYAPERLDDTKKRTVPV
ncbi:phage antirepressor KilAC domain-containing protein [Pragia fontium]|uniref:phage antirepressor KilAC domain-containing protein n=1 Tax=Pragia fontium TaxID=82985 RepID=UPI0015F03449|nr:phage antirepressor KilAC domain-containing protein [Pragia fontium]